MFAASLAADGPAAAVAGLRVELFGSLGATGHGHGSVKAVVLGLTGEQPGDGGPGGRRAHGRADPRDRAAAMPGGREIAFDPDSDIVLHRRKRLPFHSNAMRFAAIDASRRPHRRTHLLLGRRRFRPRRGRNRRPRIEADATPVPYPFDTGAELLGHTAKTGLPISGVMLANEKVRRDEAEIRAGLLRIWRVMQECVEAGCQADGVLPGGLKVRRRARALRATLERTGDRADPLYAMEWVTLYALAVNEENASGGRVVTAPTNGAAGIIPAVLHYYTTFVPGADDDGVVALPAHRGAPSGCCTRRTPPSPAPRWAARARSGSACSMAAAGLAEVLGGTPEQVENAAEIGIEHNLGLTCDPVGGLVQIPCIERNAIAAVKAITAARMAVRGDGTHHVSLDKVIKTMRETGADMKDKYKETARGGLAVNVIEC